LAAGRLRQGVLSSGTRTALQPAIGRLEHECAAWHADALRQILLRRPAVVLVSSTVGYVRGGGRTGGYAQLSYAQWREGTRVTAATLDSAGVHTLLLRDSPPAGVDVPTCLSRAVHQTGGTAGACMVAQSVGLDPAIHDAERAAIAGLERVTLLDFTGQFCARGVCQPMRKGRVVYHDDSHLTASFAATMAPMLADRIRSVVPVGGD
jgi:hypothetical protein